MRWGGSSRLRLTLGVVVAVALAACAVILPEIPRYQALAAAAERGIDVFDGSARHSVAVISGESRLPEWLLIWWPWREIRFLFVRVEYVSTREPDAFSPQDLARVLEIFPEVKKLACDGRTLRPGALTELFQLEYLGMFHEEGEIPELRTVKHLDLGLFYLREKSFAAARQCPHLEELHISGHLDCQHALQPKGLDRLRKLSLRNDWNTASWTPPPAEVLKFQPRMFRKDELAHLAELPSLRELRLNLRGTLPLDDLPVLPALESLRLHGEVDLEQLANLGRMPNLTTIEIDNESLEAIAEHCPEHFPFPCAGTIHDSWRSLRVFELDVLGRHPILILFTVPYEGPPIPGSDVPV